jgi:hypothetical protein
MPLRIGCDLDGVLADMDAGLLRQAQAVFGEAMARQLQESTESPQGDAEPVEADSTACDPTPDNVPPTARLRMTSGQQRRLWRHIATIENFWEGLTEIEPGLIARLASIAAERRWEIIFLTKRPDSAGATAQVQTQRWLESKGFTLPSVFVVQGSRGRIAAALHLDIVIDDRPENCLDVVVDSTARAILVWRDDPGQVPAAARRLGIGVVKSVAECLDILTQIDSAGKDEPGVMARVRKLLGLGESASA